MVNYYTLSKHILALVFAAGINTLFAQNTQPISRSVVSGEVVNVSEVARYELQHPVKLQVINQSLVLTQKGATAGEGNYLKSAGSGVQRGSGDSVGPSPAPVANFIAQTYDNYAPADPFGAVSENYLVSTTKYMLVVQNRNGDSLGQVFIPNFWAPVVSSIHNLEEWQDTKVDYDPLTKRWIITSFCDLFTDSSSVLIGMSQTSDPLGNWNLYKMLTDSSGATFTVFPMLGFNKNWVAVSGAVYYQNGEGYDTSSVFAFDKSALMNGAPTGVAVFKVPSYKTTVAVTYDSIIDDLYVLLPVNATIGQLMLAEITGSPGTEVFSVAGYPTSGVAYNPGPPGVGNFAPQLGSPVNLQVGNNAATSLVYANGNLWCGQTIFIPYGNPTRASVQWWQFDTTGNILQLGQIDDPTGHIFYVYPSIAVNQYDDALIGYSVFSAQQYASGAYSYHDHTMQAGVTDSSYTFIAGLNSCVDTAGNFGSNNWGLWSATVVDPADNTGFWTLQQYVPQTANTWQVQWANIDNYPTGISNISKPSPSIQIFPNPNSGTFNIALNGVTNSTVHIKILTLLGEEVWNTTASAQGSSNIIPVTISGLSKGLYFAEIYVDGFESVQKVVVE